MQIGIGTYSFGGIASFLGIGPSLLEKLQTIKSLGFDSVELLPGDLDNDVEDIKKWLAETGLTVTSIHAEPSMEVIEKMAAIGGKAVIWASTPFNSKEEAYEVGAFLEEMAEKAEPYGIKIAYHNHFSEFYFDEGKTLLEHLLDSGTKFYSQLDCGWAQYGGMYPPYFIRKYRNRILAIHVKENNKVFGPGPKPASRHGESPFGENPFEKIKDLSAEEKQKFLEDMEKQMADMHAGQPVIQGKMGGQDSNMDWKAIKEALDEQDFDAFWVVEREDFYGDHDQCIAEDCAWLRENIR